MKNNGILRWVAGFILVLVAIVFVGKNLANKTFAAPPTEKVIILGGVDFNNGLTFRNDVWSSSDPYNNNWTMLTNTPSWANTLILGDQKAVYYDNKIWVLTFGSSTATGPTISYTSDGVTWNDYTNLPFQKRLASTFFVFNDGNGDAMWILGGSGFGGEYNDVWKSYDGVNWNQVLINAPWSKRGSHTSVVFNNKMWVMGGNSSGILQKDVWSSSNGVNWVLENGNSPWGQRDGHSSVVFDNKIWIFGGTIMNNAFNFDIWSSPDGINWTQALVNSPFTSLRTDSTAFVYDNKMWLSAGHDSFLGVTHSDLYSSIDGVNWVASNPVDSPFGERLFHESLVVPINFGFCQISLATVPLPTTSFVLGNQRIASIEVTGCNEDIVLKRFEFLLTYSSGEFREENFSILDVSANLWSNASNQTATSVTFKPFFSLPLNSTKIFEVWANIVGNPSPGDTITTQLSDLRTHVPSSGQQANISTPLPLPAQTLSF